MNNIAHPGPQSRVLIVDDDAVQRMVLRAHLEGAEFDCEDAGDGSSGLGVFKSTRPDIVLVDVQMPGMNGFELCTAIRGLPEGRHVPIVMVTGNDDVESVREAYDVGATDFVTKPVNFPILIHRIQFILRHHRLVDDLRASEASLANANRIAKIGHWSYEVAEISGRHQFRCSDRTRHLLGWVTGHDQSLADLLSRAHDNDRTCLESAIDAAIADGTCADFECRFINVQGGTVVVRQWLETEKDSARGAVRIIGTIQDMTDRKRLEKELIQARKLESIGQLAAGIAHEINTPIQYISDNVCFLQGAFRSISRIDDEYAKLLDGSTKSSATPDLIRSIEVLRQELDHDFLLEEVPQAISQCLEGAGRVGEIVSAMKEFAHPGSAEKESADLNALISNAITVSRNEWKYVAEVRTDLQEELAPVPLHRGEFGQVMINLIVNAAHAIADYADESGDKMGTIEIATRQSGEAVEVQVTDSGCGISDSIAERIFDPFFTTKEVGKGTGQGLAIAHSTVVDKHGGEINVQSAVGRGATFTIKLPLASACEAEQRALA